MPRSGAYESWSSKNCLLLMGLDDNDLEGEIDWRKHDDLTTLPEIYVHDSEHPEKKISGRPHREEAILIQLKGSVAATACDNKCATAHGIFKSCRVTNLHRGGKLHFVPCRNGPQLTRSACGNCVWQSKAMECTHALAAIEAEASRKERLAEAKGKLLASKDAVNSSKRTRQTVAKQAAKRAGGEPGPVSASPTKKPKARRSGKKK